VKLTADAVALSGSKAAYFISVQKFRVSPLECLFFPQIAYINITEIHLTSPTTDAHNKKEREELQKKKNPQSIPSNSNTKHHQANTKNLASL
jgi:hypothetical protein